MPDLDTIKVNCPVPSVSELLVLDFRDDLKQMFAEPWSRTTKKAHRAESVSETLHCAPFRLAHDKQIRQLRAGGSVKNKKPEECQASGTSQVGRSENQRVFVSVSRACSLFHQWQPPVQLVVPQRPSGPFILGSCV